MSGRGDRFYTLAYALQAVWLGWTGTVRALQGPTPPAAGPEALATSEALILLLSHPHSACVHGGKTYSHGEVWHPAFRAFGPLPCILCTCGDGRQDCQRVTCPTEYPCHHPEKVAGKCCKICPGTQAGAGQSEPWVSLPRVTDTWNISDMEGHASVPQDAGHVRHTGVENVR